MSQVDSRLPGDAGEREAETRWHGPGPGCRHISCHIFTSQGASDVIKWSLWVIFHVLIKKMLVDETWYNAKITWYVRRKKFYTVHSSYHNTRNKIWNPPFLIKCLSFDFEWGFEVPVYWISSTGGSIDHWLTTPVTPGLIGAGQEIDGDELMPAESSPDHPLVHRLLHPH